MNPFRTPLLRLVLLALLVAALAACAAPTTPPLTVSATVTMNANGTSAWRITALSGSGASATTDSDNAALTLEVGKRYRIVNAAGVTEHPLALVGAGRARLLSQDPSETGSFEDDPGVDWVENGNAIVFTLTADLAAELEGYLCTVHALMFGSVTTD